MCVGPVHKQRGAPKEAGPGCYLIQGDRKYGQEIYREGEEGAHMGSAE